MQAKQDEITLARNPLADICAEDVMQSKVVTLQAGEPITVAERQLTEAQVSGAPVTDGFDNLLGIVSLRDLVRHRAEDQDLPGDADERVFDNDVDDGEYVRFERPTTGACVGDVMTTEVISVPPTMPLQRVAARMSEAKVHRVVVVDRGRLLGLISSMDILAAISKEA